MKNLIKSPCFKKEKKKEKYKKKQKNNMLSSKFSNIRNTQFDQRSRVQPISESRGVSMCVTENRERTDGNSRVKYWISPREKSRMLL